LPTISPGATIPKVAPHPKVRELRKDNEGAAKQELTRFGATAPKDGTAWNASWSLTCLLCQAVAKLVRNKRKSGEHRIKASPDILID